MVWYPKMVPDSSCHKMWALEKMDELDAVVFPYSVHTSGYMICRIQARWKSVTSHGKCQPITPTTKGNTHIPKSPNIPIIHYPFQNLLGKKGKKSIQPPTTTHIYEFKNFQWDKSPAVPCIHISVKSRKVYTVFLSALTNPLVFIPKLPDPPQKLSSPHRAHTSHPRGKALGGLWRSGKNSSRTPIRTS